jgi:protein SCO1
MASSPTTSTTDRRGLVLPALIAALWLVVGGVAGIVTAGLTGPRPVPARFEPPVEPPPGFRLRDQDGHWIGPRDTRGSVTVLTFLFTSCDDVCPAEAQTIARAARAERRGVEILAVSVDPVGDDVPHVKAFLKRIGVSGVRFHYLLGSRRELEPVWRRFHIVPIAASADQARAAARSGIDALAGEEDAPEGAHVHEGRDAPPAAKEPYPNTDDQRYRGHSRHDLPEFEHSAFVLLIDKRGRQRVGFPFEQLDQRLLERDIRVLLAEPGPAPAPRAGTRR